LGSCAKKVRGDSREEGGAIVTIILLGRKGPTAGRRDLNCGVAYSGRKIYTTGKKKSSFGGERF